MIHIAMLRLLACHGACGLAARRNLARLTTVHPVPPPPRARPSAEELLSSSSEVRAAGDEEEAASFAAEDDEGATGGNEPAFAHANPMQRGSGGKATPGTAAGSSGPVTPYRRPATSSAADDAAASTPSPRAKAACGGLGASPTERARLAASLGGFAGPAAGVLPRPSPLGRGLSGGLSLRAVQGTC